MYSRRQCRVLRARSYALVSGPNGVWFEMGRKGVTKSPQKYVRSMIIIMKSRHDQEQAPVCSPSR